MCCACAGILTAAPRSLRLGAGVTAAVLDHVMLLLYYHVTSTLQQSVMLSWSISYCLLLSLLARCVSWPVVAPGVVLEVPRLSSEATSLAMAGGRSCLSPPSQRTRAAEIAVGTHAPSHTHGSSLPSPATPTGGPTPT